MDTAYPVCGVGGELGLNLFEPRYRTMMQRITAGDRQFCYLPNFTNYSAERTDIGQSPLRLDALPRMACVG